MNDNNDADGNKEAASRASRLNGVSPWRWRRKDAEGRPGVSRTRKGNFNRELIERKNRLRNPEDLEWDLVPEDSAGMG